MQSPRLSKYIRRKATRETNRFLFSAENMGGVVIRLLLFAAYAVAIAYVFSTTEAANEAWKLGLAAVPPLVLWPIVYLAERGRIKTRLLNAAARDNSKLRADLLSRKINLVLHIDSVGRTVGPGGCCEIVAQVAIRNQGERPSAALAWAGMLVLGDERIRLPAAYTEKKTFEYGVNEHITVYAEDLIANRTIEPIKSGACVTGVFFSYVDNVRPWEEGDKLVIGCRQIDDREILAEFPLRLQHDPVISLPGLRAPFERKEVKSRGTE